MEANFHVSDGHVPRLRCYLQIWETKISKLINFINEKPLLALKIIITVLKISTITIDDVKLVSINNLNHGTAVRGVTFN